MWPLPGELFHICPIGKDLIVKFFQQRGYFQFFALGKYLLFGINGQGKIPLVFLEGLFLIIEKEIFFISPCLKNDIIQTIGKLQDFDFLFRRIKIIIGNEVHAHDTQDVASEDKHDFDSEIQLKRFDHCIVSEFFQKETGRLY
jgi:hypothetical protein